MIDACEWLETDGLGGYAMGTASRLRDRRYHGLLVVATRPPGGRMMLVNDVEVFAETAAGRFALSSHRYRDGVIYPDGTSRIVGFDWQPWPTWQLELDDDTRLSFEILMTTGCPRVHLRWARLAGTGPLRLAVRPLLSGRDHHALHHENPAFCFRPARRDDRVQWTPYPGVPAVTARASGTYRHAPLWYRRFVYTREAARGLDCEEDLASPGVFELDLDGHAATVEFAAGEVDGAGSAARWHRTSALERHRRESFPGPLHRAADSYLVARGEGRTVIAGYPWFTDWGRDSFVALRGLCLAGGRHDDARRSLLAWAEVISDGMVPNRFLESGQRPEFNSVDASLWYVVAVDAYLTAARACPPADRHRLERAIAEIVAGYHRGTRHGIAADRDELLRCGVPGLQLTWMDARVGDRVITPRIGKPVEVQALWINALAIAAGLDGRWRAVFARARASFEQRFWNPTRHMLYDVIDCDHRSDTVDPTFRPNQIFAIGGLPLPVLDGDRARAVVDVIERELWTPAGLRSLARGEPGYTPRYQGGVAERDGAYHQGTVWTWLAGPFIEAWVRVGGDTAAARTTARRRYLAPLLARLETGGVGHLGEIADAEEPHPDRGCPFQAWSVAEALRLDRAL